MNPNVYFATPTSPAQRRYEALRAFYTDNMSASEVADKFAMSPSYFKKLRFEFVRCLKKGENQFFPHRKTGPKERSTNTDTIQRIIVHMKKKTHLPLLFELPWLKKNTHISWMGMDIKFVQGNVS